MDYALAQFNMIEQHIRPWEVLDNRVLDAMASVPRHEFVPNGFEALAYSETAIPLLEGVHMLEPKIIGRLLQALSPQAHECALEIGTGSGYLTAILTRLCAQVDSIEINDTLAQQARTRLAQLGLSQARVITGNAFDLPLPSDRPYDLILLTGSVSEKPMHWLKALSIGGRCAAVVGSGEPMHAICYTRSEEDQWLEEILFETHLPALEGPKPKAIFSF